MNKMAISLIILSLANYMAKLNNYCLLVRLTSRILNMKGVVSPEICLRGNNSLSVDNFDVYLT